MIDSVDTTHDIVRARRGRVAIELSPIGVQSKDAARMLGISVDLLNEIPFDILPFRRNGTRRWYLVRLLNEFAEHLFAEQVVRGVPPSIEHFAAYAKPYREYSTHSLPTPR